MIAYIDVQDPPEVDRGWRPRRRQRGTISGAILGRLHTHGPQTAKDMAAAFGFPVHSVKVALGQMRNRGQVDRCGTRKNPHGGHPAWVWRLCAAGEFTGKRRTARFAPLAPAVQTAEIMGEVVKVCRELLAAAEGEHRRAVAAVKAWAGEHTDPPETKATEGRR